MAHSDYRSDITLFLQSLKAQDPSLEAKQREARSTLWDKQPSNPPQPAIKHFKEPQTTGHQKQLWKF